MIYYAGVGARNTPFKYLNKIFLISAKLADMGFVLRSSGAEGADSSFELGCDSAKDKKEIFLPWKNNRNGIDKCLIVKRKNIIEYLIFSRFY